MGIKDNKNESTLIKYFVPYAWCLNCQTPEGATNLDDKSLVGADSEKSLADSFPPGMARKSLIKTVNVFYSFNFILILNFV